MEEMKINFWESLTKLTYRSESEVEDRFIIPLFRELGWPINETHTQVPVEFHQGRTIGRKPEADIVFAPENQNPPKIAWIVIEAKKPTESMNRTYNQAFSYSYMLKSAFFVSTNGDEFELWQVLPFSEPSKLFSSKVADLASHRGYLEMHLSRPPILEFYKKHIPTMYVKEGVDLVKYFETIVTQTYEPSFIERTLESSRNPGQFLTIGSGKNFDVLHGRKIFISGWGGRGKTSVLRLILRNQITTKDSRVSIYLDLRDLKRDSILETIFEKLKFFSSKLNSPLATFEWIKLSKTTLLLDNWDSLSDKTTILIEEELNRFNTCDALIVAAARSNVQIPYGYEAFEIRQFQNHERDEVILNHLREKNESADVQYILRKTNPALIPLLNEPVILGKYLELLSETSFGQLLPPADLSSLMKSLLESLLKSRHNKLYKKADEITAICTALASGFKEGFSLKEIAKCISDAGLDSSPSDLSDELVSMGLMERRASDRYSFSHEIWATYFKSSLLLLSVNGNQFKEWITMADKGELYLLSPFLVPMIENEELLNHYINHAMKIDIELYLYILGIQAKTFTAKKSSKPRLVESILNDIYEGRITFIDRYFKVLKNVFDPWKYSDGSHNERNEKPVLVGTLEDEAVYFFLGFAKVATKSLVIENSEFVPSKHPYKPRRGYSYTSIKLKPTDLDVNFRHHPSLARFISTRKVLEELKDVVTKSVLPPLGFAKSELFVSWLQELRISGDREILTVSQIKDMLESKLNIATQDIAKCETSGTTEDNVRFFEMDYSRFNIEAFSELTKSLIKDGKENLTIAQLSLPKPDLTHSKHTRYFSDLYSDEQRISRVQALYDQTLITYREYCEVFFSDLNNLFFYTQCPCRYIINLDENNNGWGSGWSYRHEPVKSWGTPSIVKIGQQNFKDFQDYADAYKEAAKKLSRPGEKFSMGSRVGLWDPNESAVTNLVMEFLKKDIEELIRRIDE